MSKGDCFEVAGKAIVANRLDGKPDDDTLKLVHGLVLCTLEGGTAKVGERHWHAWIEQELRHPDWPEDAVAVICVDRSNGHDVQLPQSFYYATGHIDPEQVHRYTAQEAAVQMIETGHYGPWEET